jgi:single-strand DNA-binding protein
MNHITLTGRNVKEISLKYTPNGKEVCSGTIAVQKNFKNQEGKYDSDFIDFVCWGARSKVLADYVQKGDKFGISGRLSTRTYENSEGKKIKVHEVNVEDFDLPSNSQNNPSHTNTSNNDKNRSQGFTKVDEDPFAGNGAIDISDDDLPF